MCTNFLRCVLAIALEKELRSELRGRKKRENQICRAKKKRKSISFSIFDKVSIIFNIFETIFLGHKILTFASAFFCRLARVVLTFSILHFWKVSLHKREKKTQKVVSPSPLVIDVVQKGIFYANLVFRNKMVYPYPPNFNVKPEKKPVRWTLATKKPQKFVSSKLGRGKDKDLNIFCLHYRHSFRCLGLIEKLASFSLNVSVGSRNLFTPFFSASRLICQHFR